MRLAVRRRRKAGGNFVPLSPTRSPARDEPTRPRASTALHSLSSRFSNTSRDTPGVGEMATERLPPVNLIIRDTLRGRIPSSDKAGQPVALSLTEFDDVRYLMLLDPSSPDLFQLSMAVPSDPSGTEGAKARAHSSITRMTHVHGTNASAVRSSHCFPRFAPLRAGTPRRGDRSCRADVRCVRYSRAHAFGGLQHHPQHLPQQTPNRGTPRAADRFLPPAVAAATSALRTQTLLAARRRTRWKSSSRRWRLSDRSLWGCAPLAREKHTFPPHARRRPRPARQKHPGLTQFPPHAGRCN